MIVDYCLEDLYHGELPSQVAFEEKVAEAAAQVLGYEPIVTRTAMSVGLQIIAESDEEEDEADEVRRAIDAALDGWWPD